MEKRREGIRAEKRRERIRAEKGREDKRRYGERTRRGEKKREENGEKRRTCNTETICNKTNNPNATGQTTLFQRWFADITDYIHNQQ